MVRLNLLEVAKMLWRRVSKAGAASLVLLGVSGALPRAAPMPVPKPLRSMLICHFSGAGDYQSRSVGAALGRMLGYRASNLSRLSNLPPKIVVDRALRQEGLGRDMALDAVNARKVAAVAGQEWVVVGSVRRVNSSFIVRVQIYGVATGRMIGKPIVTSGAEAELPGMEAELARNLFGGAGIALTPKQRFDLGKLLTTRPAAIRLLGDYLLASERDAPKILTRLVDADPGFPVAGVCQEDAAYRAGRYWEALTLARRWKALFPRNKDFASYEFGALAAMKRFREAASVLDQIEAHYPDSFCLVWLRSQLSRLEGKYWSALQAAKRLVELNPASSEGHARTAAAALENGMRLGAELYLGEVTAGRAGDFAAAIDSACKAGEQAAALDGKYEEVWLTLIAAHRERGDYAKSLQTSRRLAAANPKNCQGKLSQALTYFCWNKIDLAKITAEAALIQKPDFPEALVVLALCAKSQGDQKKAESSFRRALALDKRCGDVSYLRYQKLWPIQVAEQALRLAPKIQAGG